MWFVLDQIHVLAAIEELVICVAFFQNGVTIVYIFNCCGIWLPSGILVILEETFCYWGDCRLRPVNLKNNHQPIRHSIQGTNL